MPIHLAAWAALVLFVAAALTDYVDGYLARRLNQMSRFGKMIDPIADKAMVVIALILVVGLSGMDLWLLPPVTVILFREVFVSGLREFLGADAGRLSVTSLAKWKTTVQMTAIGVLLGAIALDQTHLAAYLTMTPEAYQQALDTAEREWSLFWLGLIAAGPLWWLGVALLWIAGALTAVTGYDYFAKAAPYLKDDP